MLQIAIIKKDLIPNDKHKASDIRLHHTKIITITPFDVTSEIVVRQLTALIISKWKIHKRKWFDYICPIYCLCAGKHSPSWKMKIGQADF